MSNGLYSTKQKHSQLRLVQLFQLQWKKCNRPHNRGCDWTLRCYVYGKRSTVRHSCFNSCFFLTAWVPLVSSVHGHLTKMKHFHFKDCSHETVLTDAMIAMIPPETEEVHLTSCDLIHSIPGHFCNGLSKLEGLVIANITKITSTTFAGLDCVKAAGFLTMKFLFGSKKRGWFHYWFGIDIRCPELPNPVLPNGFAILGCHYSLQVFSTSSQATARNYESANNATSDDQYLLPEGAGNGNGYPISRASAYPRSACSRSLRQLRRKYRTG